MINFVWGKSCRVWGLQRALQLKRNSAQVLLTSPIILQLRLLIFNLHIKQRWCKSLMELPQSRPAMKDPSTRTGENSLNRLKFLPKAYLDWNTNEHHSNTPLLGLDTSFCLHTYLRVCSFNHSLTAKKGWINYKLWEEQDSIPYPIFFTFKRTFKCSHRYTNIAAGLYSACLSGSTSLKIETVFSYYTKPPVWSCWII